jgi:hypothetical protein
MTRNQQTPEERSRQALEDLDEKIRQLKAKIHTAVQNKSDYWNEAVAITIEQNFKSKAAKKSPGRPQASWTMAQ